MSVARALAPSVVAILFAAASACGGDDDETFDPSLYDGTYDGTWVNKTTGAEGPVTIAITMDEGAGTASLTLDFGGNYLGLGDPPPATLAGTFDDDGALVKGESELFGSYNVTIDADGKIVGVMERLGGGAIPKLTYTGTVTDEKLDADYVVTLPDGNTANAELRMAKSD